MIRVRKKSIALIVALVFMFTIVAPMAAFAANDDYTSFSSTRAYVTTGDEQEAGKVTVASDFDGDSVQGEVYEVIVRLVLPDGVEFTDTPEKEWVKAPLATDFKMADSSFGSSYAEVTIGKNDKTAFGGEWGNVVFDFAKFDTINKWDARLDIDSDFTGDLKVRVTVSALHEDGAILFTDWDDLVIAQVSGADINVTAKDPKTVQIGDATLAKITIKEGQAGAFDKNDWIRFAIVTNGVKFQDPTTSDFGQSRLTHKFAKDGTNDTEVTDGAEALNEDRNSFKIFTGAKSKGLPGEISFTPKVKVNPSVTGDIKIRVTSENKDLSSTTVTVGTVGDVTGEFKKVKDNDTVVYAGSRGTELDVSFEIEAVGDTKFDKDKLISLTLNNGKFVEQGKTGKADMGEKDWELYNSDKSVYYTIPDDSTDKIKVKNIHVKCNNDVEVGDIVLTAGGNAGVKGEVVIGEYAQPFTVTAETPNILSEALNQKAGDIVITEVDAEALEKGSAVFFELPSGVELKGTPKVEVDEGNIDVEDPVVIDKNIIALEVKSESSDASTIRIHNIKYDTGRLALYGPVELEVYMAEESDKTDWKAIDGVMLTVANAIVDDQNTVTATFTLGDEGVTIVNGRTLVQVNLLCDVLGLQKSWDAAAKTAYFAKDGKVVAFPMNENAIYINGVKLPVDQGGKIINDFTYATLRGVQLAFGGELDWDNDTKTATFVFNK